MTTYYPERIAALSDEENHAWEFAFCFYLDAGRSEIEADKLAWRDLIREFRRLRSYRGAY
jgi:hypothetical protein